MVHRRPDSNRRRKILPVRHGEAGPKRGSIKYGPPEFMKAAGREKAIQPHPRGGKSFTNFTYKNDTWRFSFALCCKGWWRFHTHTHTPFVLYEVYIYAMGKGEASPRRFCFSSFHLPFLWWLELG